MDLPGGKAQHQMLFVVNYCFAVFKIQNNCTRDMKKGFALDDQRLKESDTGTVLLSDFLTEEPSPCQVAFK